MVRLKEGNQIFEFPEGTQAIKFDETTFFLRRFNAFPKVIQEFLFSSRWMDENRQRYIVLHLDGDFASYTWSKKMIMADLQRSMQTKLRWLNCKVSVVDADTYCRKVYTLISERN